MIWDLPGAEQTAGQAAKPELQKYVAFKSMSKSDPWSASGALWMLLAGKGTCRGRDPTKTKPKPNLF